MNAGQSGGGKTEYPAIFRWLSINLLCSNPLEVMDQITYLLFLRRLVDLQSLEENKSVQAIEWRFFPTGQDAKGRDLNDLRWLRFRNFTPAEMFTVVEEHVFPFLHGIENPDIR